MARALRKLAGVRLVVLLVVVLAGACAAPSDRERYVDDREFRRAALVDELVTTTNDYSRARLAHYGKDWDDLPVWNPTALDIDVSPTIHERCARSASRLSLATRRSSARPRRSRRARADRRGCTHGRDVRDLSRR